jgi:hypothetical protein
LRRWLRGTLAHPTVSIGDNAVIDAGSVGHPPCAGWDHGLWQSRERAGEALAPLLCAQKLEQKLGKDGARSPMEDRWYKGGSGDQAGDVM